MTDEPRNEANESKFFAEPLDLDAIEAHVAAARDECRARGGFSTFDTQIVALVAELRTAQAENTELRTRITAALALHAKDESVGSSYPFCKTCADVGDDLAYASWPCPTVRALNPKNPQ